MNKCKNSTWPMKVCCQFWRFYKIKRHHWKITCGELLLPFLLGVVIYHFTKGLNSLLLPGAGETDFGKPCHFREQYLPSSGLSLWLQSEICRRSPSCDRQEYTFSPICPLDNNKVLDCFVNWHSEIGSHSPKYDVQRLREEICPRTGETNNTDHLAENIEVHDPINDDPCHNHYFFQEIAGGSTVLNKALLGKILYTPNDTRASRIIEDAIEHNFGTFLKQSSKLHDMNDDGFINETVQFIKCIATDRFETVNNESYMVERAKVLNSDEKFLAAIIFNFSEDEEFDSLPSYLNYTIRTIQYDYDPAKEPTKYSPLQGASNGATNLILVVQDLIDNAFMRLSSQASNKNLTYATSLQQMSQPCTATDKLGFVKNTVPIFLTVPIIIFLFPFTVLVGQIVQEKEDGMKQFMLIMSMKPHQYWASWFGISMLWWLVLFLLLFMFLADSGFQYYVDQSLFFFVTLFFIMASISQAMLVSCVFNSSKRVSMITGLFYLALIYLSLVGTYTLYKDGISSTTLAFLSLFPQVGYIIGIDLFIIDAINPRTGYVPTWNDLKFSQTGGHQACVMIIVLFIDTMLYILLTLYADTLFPGSYGIPQGWCFCLSKIPNSLKNQFKKIKSKVQRKSGTETKARSQSPSVGGELNTSNNHSTNGVELHSVTKTFSSQQGELTAVNNVTLTFRPNEITILLGQNGAGKTTLFSLIVGTQKATSGTIYVEGLNIIQQTKEAQKTLGFCPQTNTLFSYLTVAEHIWLFNALKAGQRPNQSEISDILSKAKFQEFEDDMISKLSGGTKRKLSVCLAFCGNAKVVVLDEPTSGVDPLSRRAIWSVLNEFKQGRTIIMSTHFMEEADEIGDKIAIIDLGTLIALDNPISLKQKFAQFYKLIVASTNERTISLIDQITKDAYEGKDIKKHVGQDETEYTLPNQRKNDTKNITKVLTALEKENNLEFGIKSSGIEDVFMASLQIRNKMDDQTDTTKQILRPQLEGTTHLYLQHVYALMTKRFHSFKRDCWGPFTIFFFPTIFLFILLVPLFSLGANLKNPNDVNKVEQLVEEMSNHLFHHHSQILRFPYTKNVHNDELDSFEEILFSTSGMGTSCHTNREHYYSQKICNAAPSYEEIQSFQTKKTSNGCNNCCECKFFNGQACDDDRISQHVNTLPSVQLASGELLLNVNGQSMQQYFLDTDRYSFKSRYGGLEITSPKFRTSNVLDVYKNETLFDFVFKIWFDGRMPKSGPAYLNSINNINLQTLCLRDQTCGISTWSSPIVIPGKNQPRPPSLFDGLNQEVLNAFALPFFLLIILSIVSTFWVMPYVQENLTKLRLLMYLEGLSPVTYWTAGLLAEYCIYIMYCILLLIILVAFQMRPFTNNKNVEHVFSLFVLFGFANTPMSGFFSIFVKSGTQLFSIMAMQLMIALGSGFYMLPLRMTYPAPNSSIFIIQPHFCLFDGLNIIGNLKFDEFDTIKRSTHVVNLNEWSYLGKYYFTLITVGVVAYAALLLFENWRHLWKGHYCQKVMSKNNDVKEAKSNNGNALKVEQIEKCYTTICKYGTIAVIDLTFTVKENTCFGMLGMNGAGKTTVLKMLTEEVLPDAGKIIWPRENGYKLGYCPQFDTHDKLLTPEETLYFHCRIHNYPEKEIKELVSCVLNMLDLYGYKNVICRNLSGGTNRRLSAGIAFLGAPQMVLLDEPSTGLDPVARRRIWNLIKYPAYSDQAFILVSHVMEECEALCDVIGIMVKGRFTCKGTPQQLKNKFGNKYMVKIDKLVLGGTFVVLDWVKDKFQSAIIEEETNSSIKFSVCLDDVRLSTIFSILNKLEPGADNQVPCYTVSQATFDDVFLKLANKSPEPI